MFRFVREIVGPAEMSGPAVEIFSVPGATGAFRAPKHPAFRARKYSVLRAQRVSACRSLTCFARKTPRGVSPKYPPFRARACSPHRTGPFRERGTRFAKCGMRSARISSGSISPSTDPSIPIHPSIHPSIYGSIDPSIHRSIDTHTHTHTHTHYRKHGRDQPVRLGLEPARQRLRRAHPPRAPLPQEGVDVVHLRGVNCCLLRSPERPVFYQLRERRGAPARRTT